MREVEIVGLRKEREKHFLQENGEMVAKVYSNPVHYKKENKYEEIDNTLIKENNFYRNKNNDYTIQFMENTEHLLMKMIKDTYFLEVKLNNQNNVNGKFIDNKVVYNEILPNVDLEYSVLPTKVKENIILKSNNINKISFLIKTNLELSFNGKKIDAKINNNTIFTFEPMFMIDNNQDINQNIYYNLNKRELGYQLELILDERWLETASYPVVIDPIITNTTQEGKVYDTYISNDSDKNRNGYEYIKAGVQKYNGEDVIHRSLIKFDLPTIGTGSQVIKAYLNLISYPVESADVTWTIVDIHQLTHDWTEENANWSTMHDKYNSKIETYINSRRSMEEETVVDGEVQTLMHYIMPNADITNLVKKWYADTPNYGIMLKSHDEIYVDDQYPRFYSNVQSGLAPSLIIHYRNQTGLESYMNYISQRYTNINTYNGNLVGSFLVGRTSSENHSVNLNLVYNTNDVVLNKNNNLGKGFKFNYQQIVEKVAIGETMEQLEYLKYTDEDGTIHYFIAQLNDSEESSNLYVDEEGLNLSIIQDGYKYNMLDKYGNTLIFNIVDDIGYLSKIIDTDGRTIQITYDDNNRVTKVIDSRLAEINIIYNEEDIIIQSIDDIVTLKYDNGKLISINTLLGNILFNYNSNSLIESITDVNGLSVKYEYYDQTPYRIKKVSEFGVNNDLGNYFELFYSHNSTTVKNHKNREKSMTFNNEGNLISISSLVNDDNLKDAYSISNNYLESQYGNKLIGSSTPIKFVKNLLTNTSFEEQKINFISEGNELILATEYVNNGLKSLKATSSFYQEVVVEKGKFYTFSAYIKNDKDMKILLSYDNEIQEENIQASLEFCRHDISIFYSNEATSNLKIRFALPEDSVIYIDDIQLEEGKIANHYNMISNSDFSLGINDWQTTIIKNNELINNDNYFEVISFNDNNKSLKISMSPNCETTLAKTFPIRGKKGDYYELSFWYKYEGINGEELIDSYMENKVNISFSYIEDVEVGPLPPPIFNPNREKWQYYRCNFYALGDYESLTLKFEQKNNVNDLYITNISLLKDPRQINYGYDEFGNMTYIINQSHYSTDFKYDSNNRLIKVTDPHGKSVKYEYDNSNPERILNYISETGITKNIKYDSFGNTIVSKTIPMKHNELVSGLYTIRGKGTYDYIKNINKAIKFVNDDCKYDLWNFNSIGDGYYTINHSVINDNYFFATSNQVILMPNDLTRTIFKLIKQENGSYYIEVYNLSEGNSESVIHKYIKRKNDILVVSEMKNSDSSFEFYIEPVEKKFIEGNIEYTLDGKFVKEVIDSNLNKSMYNINEQNGLLNSITNSKKMLCNYIYDDKKRLIKINQGNKEINYLYNLNNVIYKIKDDDKEYNFIYDDFLNIKEMNLGSNIILITNNYDKNNGNVISSTYGNGHEIKYIYDGFDRIKTITTMNNIYNYYYDNTGNLAKLESDDIKCKYIYDCSKKLTEYKFNDFKIKYAHDACDNIISKNYTLNNVANCVDNFFNLEDTISRVNFDNECINYYYDEFCRLTRRVINSDYNTLYTYLTNGNRTTLLIDSVNNNNDIYNYKYDELNNITHIYHNGTLENKYEYDEYNQLIEEKNYIDSEIIKYKYDKFGNILNKKVLNIDNYDVKLENKYEYNNNDWPDQLTKFNEKELTYDSIGNPLTIGDNVLTWVNGKQLNSYNNNYYKYDINGIRTAKIVNGIETKYYFEGASIIFEKRNNDVIYYIRNDVDNLVGFKYNDLTYYYVKNLQNDIIGILDSNYNLIVNYRYDSWGNILSITDINGNDINDDNHVGNINPFRYRSYYYDIETKLYYLNSRYYDPMLGRFLNTDEIIGANQDIMAYNLYNYCGNNPVTNSDNFGNFFKSIVKKVLNTMRIAKKNIAIKKAVKKVSKTVKKITKSISKSNENLEDYTDELISLMFRNGGQIFQLTQVFGGFAAFGAFFDNSKESGAWNYRNSDNWEDDLGIPFPGDKKFLLCGREITVEDFGNINYGFVGASMGISPTILYMGGGYAKIGLSLKLFKILFKPYYGDDPNDHEAVEFGIYLFNNGGYC